MTPNTPKPVSVHALIQALHDARVLPRVQAICAKHNASVEEVLGNSKVRRISWARQAIWADMREIREHGTNLYSLPDIGRLFNRNHGTVQAGINEHFARILSDQRRAA